MTTFGNFDHFTRITNLPEYWTTMVKFRNLRKIPSSFWKTILEHVDLHGNVVCSDFAGLSWLAMWYSNKWLLV